MPLRDKVFTNSACLILERVALFRSVTEAPEYGSFLLDTGAAYSMISSRLFTWVSGTNPIIGSANLVQHGGVILRTNLVKAELLLIDGVVSAYDVEFAKTTIGNLEVQVDGVLGGTFLSKVGVYLQLERNIVKFYYD